MIFDIVPLRHRGKAGISMLETDIGLSLPVIHDTVDTPQTKLAGDIFKGCGIGYSVLYALCCCRRFVEQESHGDRCSLNIEGRLRSYDTAKSIQQESSA